ncbi:uncharacterized protein LOC119575893 [Penaeus monodon]|uniref:uncharacterized protein LOC119575893 n=1 Tax=Penaeus monodon TaxID=6687 RepID=UPI0018A6E84B|nr:uncharacterized protein LOC119575893 [Penaeus monodon]
MKVTPVDERILLVRMKHTRGFISLVAVYAPTEESGLHTKLDSVVDQCPQGDNLMVLGTSVRSLALTGKDTSYGYDFARSRRLRIAGSWYQRRDLHRWTCYSYTGDVAKGIDHFLVDTCWRILQNCRVFRSAGFFVTDHRFIVATVRLRLRSGRIPRSHQQVSHLERLKSEEVAQEYAVAVSNRFEGLALYRTLLNCGIPIRGKPYQLLRSALKSDLGEGGVLSRTRC